MKCGQEQTILTELLCPEPYDHFFDEIVGRQVLHLRDGNVSARASIIGDDPRNAILDAYEAFAPNLTCHSGSANVAPPEARRVSSADEFMALVREYHDAGFTVRIPDATDLTPELRRLCRAIEAIFENPASAVIFWSEAGADAPVHHDEYDLIAIQLLGRKRWFVSLDPPTLPNTWKGIGEGEPSFERHRLIDVKPGDLLYIPRGVAHTVVSTTESIHAAIGFVPVTLREAMAAAVDYLSELGRAIRDSITARADALSRGEGMRDVANQLRFGLRELQARCQSDEFIKAAMEYRRARMIHQLPRLKAKDAEGKIGLGTRVRHNPLALAQVLRSQRSVDVRLPGERILIHRGAEDALRHILSTPEFRVSDLPGPLGDDVKVALVSRLVKSGYLEPVGMQ